MKRICVVALALSLATGVASAQRDASSTVEGSHDASVPLSRVIAVVASKTGKKFVLDPRVHADVVLIGQDPSQLSYGDLLTVLATYGFVGVESGGYVRVAPEANARQLPVPTITSKDTRPDAEIVTLLVVPKSIPAEYLVPVLRPLLPQQAHLTAVSCTNTLIITDSFANVHRIEGMIRALDTGPPYTTAGCGARKSPAPSD